MARKRERGDRSAQMSAYRAANLEEIRARDRARYDANKADNLARQKAYRDADKAKAAARARKYRADNLEMVRTKDRARAKAKGRAYHHAHRDKILAYQRKYRAAAKEQIRQKALVSLYGVTHEQVAAVLAEQGNACAICLRPADTRKMCVDHDHSTGSFRGVLCRQCNIAIGLMSDDPARLEGAADYLRRAVAARAA